MKWRKQKKDEKNEKQGYRMSHIRPMTLKESSLSHTPIGEQRAQSLWRERCHAFPFTSIAQRGSDDTRDQLTMAHQYILWTHSVIWQIRMNFRVKNRVLKGSAIEELITISAPPPQFSACACMRMHGRGLKKGVRGRHTWLAHVIILATMSTGSMGLKGVEVCRSMPSTVVQRVPHSFSVCA